MATVLGRFWTTPGRNYSIRWASRPARPSPRHFPIRSSRPNSSRPASVGALTPTASELGGFGLRLSAPDMLKIGELYRRDGVWNGQQIVPSAWIHQCTSPSSYETKIEGPSDEGYGLLWWIIDKPKQAGYDALGFGGQLIIVLPNSRAVIVYLTDVQPGSAIDGRDLEPLDNVLISAFPP